MAQLKTYKTQTDRRSSTLFVVACEGRRSEDIYLSFLTSEMRRVALLSLPTDEDGRSAPRHLLERLQKWKRENRAKARDAHLWMVFDVDHHFNANNVAQTHDVMNEATRCSINVALSDPRFELWLLLHFEDVTSCPGNYCEERLRLHLGGYSHSKYNPNPCRAGVGEAIRRSIALSVDASSRLPPSPGTNLHHLLLAILNA